MPSVLISGANRGLGFEFARQYAGDGWTVHATARNLGVVDDLEALGPNVHIHQLDVMEQESINALAAGLPKSFGRSKSYAMHPAS